MNFKVKMKDSMLTVRIKMDSGENLDQRELDRFSCIYLRGFMKPGTVKKNTIEYTGPFGVCLADALRRPLTGRDFLFVMEHVISAVQKLQSNNLYLYNLLMDLNHVYYNENTKELHFIYIPIVGRQAGVNLIEFINMILMSVIPADAKAAECVPRFTSFFRSMKPFDLAKLEQFIQKEDKTVVDAVKKNSAGQSGFMTNKQQHYIDHYEQKGAAPNQPAYPAPNNVPQQKSAYPMPASYPAPNNVPQQKGTAPNQPAYPVPNNVPQQKNAYPMPASYPAPNNVPQQQNAYPMPASNPTPNSVPQQKNAYPMPAGYPAPNNVPPQVQAAPVYEKPVVLTPPEPVYTPPVYTEVKNPEPTPVQADPDELTGLLEEDDSTGLLEGADETEVLTDGEEDATSLLQEEEAVHFPTLTRVSTNESAEINKPVFRVGKEKNYVDFFIANGAVSRSHADIITRGSKYFITDLNSTNHTFINDQLVPVQCEVELHDGDRVRLANEDFIFNL